MDKRNARDGESIEEIGTYDNVTDQKNTRVTVNAERALYWIGKGAKPSRIVHQLFKRNGVYSTPAAPAGSSPAAPAAPAPAAKKPSK